MIPVLVTAIGVLLVALPFLFTRVTLPTWLAPGLARNVTHWFALGSESSDPEGLALLAAVLAGADRELLERHPPALLRGGAIAAEALVAWREGASERACTLMGSLSLLDERVLPPRVASWAEEWLVAEAAQRGDWTSAASLEGGTRAGRFVALVARRVLHRVDGPLDGELEHAWALTLRPALKPLLDRALKATAPTPIRPVPPGTPLQRALELHRRASLGLATVHQAVTAWEHVTADPAWVRSLQKRRAGLGAGSAADAVTAVLAGISQELAEIAMDREERLSAAGGPLRARTLRDLRDRLLDDVEGCCELVGDRVEQRRALPPIEEWACFLEILEAYERAAHVGGESVRRLAFARVDPEVTGLAVWLFNDRGERSIANAMFRFLLREAQALGRPTDHKRRNVACGV